MPNHQQTQQSKKPDTTFQKQATYVSQTPVSNPYSIIQRAKINPKSLTHADVMQLQRTIGNRAVAQLLSSIGSSSTAHEAPIQRSEIPEEEENPMQGKFETVQRSEIPEEEEPLQGMMVGTIQRQEIPEEEEPLQTKRENNTGMPDNLKAGVENLSGIDMSDVRVHYNSPKPAEVGALAYTQGTDIHVASGQERHLPHEAWHVVQQAQGRVKPTMQMKGLVINDDAGLEREADFMGNKAVEFRRNDYNAYDTIQQYKNNNFCDMKKNQRRTDDESSIVQMFPWGTIMTIAAILGCGIPLAAKLYSLAKNTKKLSSAATTSTKPITEEDKKKAKKKAAKMKAAAKKKAAKEKAALTTVEEVADDEETVDDEGAVDDEEAVGDGEVVDDEEVVDDKDEEGDWIEVGPGGKKKKKKKKLTTAERVAREKEYLDGEIGKVLDTLSSALADMQNYGYSKKHKFVTHGPTVEVDHKYALSVYQHFSNLRNGMYGNHYIYIVTGGNHRPPQDYDVTLHTHDVTDLEQSRTLAIVHVLSH